MKLVWPYIVKVIVAPCALVVDTVLSPTSYSPLLLTS